MNRWGHKANASAFLFADKIRWKKRKKKWLFELCDKRKQASVRSRIFHWRYDVLRVRNNSIPFARYTFSFWFKMLVFSFCESKRFGKTCVLLFIFTYTKKYGYVIIFRRTKKNGIWYTQRHAGTLPPSFSPWIRIFTLENQVAPLNNHMLIGRKSVGCCDFFSSFFIVPSSLSSFSVI